MPAIRRVLYRYIKYIQLPRKEISKVPPFFPNFLDVLSTECLYTAAILKAWDPCHYKRCRWYLDCPVKNAPLFNVALRNSLQPALSKIAASPPAYQSPGTAPKRGSAKHKAAQKKSKGKGNKRKVEDTIELEDDDIPANTTLNQTQATIVVDAALPAPKRPHLLKDPERKEEQFTPTLKKVMS
ncbi:hypothetical protein KC19_VG088100 [Ceratodon purpureus]|uniref:Uncharacterized protein n=1 Tax=Ceratodon purpureus TaxID=3225 RepID=A0A8T0HNL2_CERPU|nr:hypothetical protein KC19_VG088100 [Ceratodon purpureus]